MATELLPSKEAPSVAKLPVEGGFIEKMAFDLSLEEAGAQKAVKRKMNFPSRRNSVFRGKTTYLLTYLLI